jgi:hypothetical protein
MSKGSNLGGGRKKRQAVDGCHIQVKSPVRLSRTPGEGAYRAGTSSVIESTRWTLIKEIRTGMNGFVRKRHTA